MRHQVHSFVTLDGLRGIAALAVVMFHGDPYFVPISVSHGYLAVDFFFGLSGVVLAHAYTMRLRQDMSALVFMQLRIIRLYPLYILGTAFGLLSLLPAPPDWAFEHFSINLVAAVLFLPSPASIIFFPFNHPLWSLFHELVANFAFAALSKRLSLAILCGIVAVSAVFLVEEARWWGTLDSSNGWENWAGGFIRVSFSFFVGVLVYRIWQKRHAPVNLPAPILGLCLLAVLSIPVPNNHEAVYDTCVVLVAFPLLLWFGASSKPTRQVATICSWMGEISYAVYVLHWPMILAAAYVLRMPQELPWGVLLIVAIALAADVATRFFDRPVRRRLMAWLNLDARPEVATDALSTTVKERSVH
jgi:peptidoglycan/LPS O-acetylase OafA/YrhL